MLDHKLTTSNVLNLFDKHIVEYNFIENEALLKDVHWKLDESNLETLIFYRLYPDEESLNKLIRRIPGKKYGVLILNRRPNGELRQFLKNFIVIEEEFFFKAQLKILNLLYPLPEKKIRLVGVTGTNGKTTTCYLAAQLLSYFGKQAFYLGSLGLWTQKNGFEKTESGLTTPPLIEYRKLLYKLADQYNYGLIEVSSHALSMQRILGTQFEMVLWTSFSQDHLDFHKTMENYFQAKLKILDFMPPHKKLIFIPKDENSVKERLIEKKVPFEEVPIYSNMDQFPLFLKTEFNKKNFSLAMKVCSNILKKKNLKVDGKKLDPVPGRFEVYDFKDRQVIIDSAHTPDALEKICSAIRNLCPNILLWCLFGCGGDRDHTKRPIMGNVALKMADFVIVTTDNPRYEDPRKIIDQIVEKLDSNKYRIIEQRDEAVLYAFQNMPEGAILLIAGKGNEEYQEISGKKIPYSDREILQRLSQG